MPPFPSIKGLTAGLLSGPIMLAALPVGALELAPGSAAAGGRALLAQASASADTKIPAEVQGWFDAAKVADGTGNTGEALRLQRQVVAWLQANRPVLDLFRARALSNLGLYLGKAGQAQEALPPTQEAVRILRLLEPSQPEARGFLDLPLNSLGILYSELGRRQEALPPTEEAVKILRELAKTNPAFQGDLAASLRNLGLRYRELGRRQEALAPTEEAVKVLRELAKTNPAFQGDLATALNSLGIRYSELGRRQEALAPREEAVKIGRELAKTNPAFQGDLAASLSNLGVSYSELGRRQEALAPTEEAVRIHRELAKTNPSFQDDLAASLRNLGVSYSELGRRQEAQAPTEEAVKILRELAKTNPAFQGDLSASLRNLGVSYSELGRRQEALAPTEEAVKVLRELAKTNPTFQGDLAASLSNLGVSYSELGRRQEALAPSEEAVKIRRELAKTNPAFQGGLASSLSNLGVRYSELGRRQEALAPTEEAVMVLRELAKTNPAFQGDLASSLSNLGVSYRELGRGQEALPPTEEAVRIRRELAKTNPAYQGDLAASLNNLGNRYSELGRRQEALAPTEEAVMVLRELAKTNPAFQGDLAAYLNNLGVLYSELGRRQKALAPTEEAVKIRRELAKSNPAFQSDLAQSATNLASLQLQLNNPGAALPLLRESVSSEVTYLQGQLPLLPEGRRLELVAVFGDRWQIPFSFTQQGEAGAALALFTRLNRQGLLQDIQRSQSLLARSGPQRPLFEQLSAVTAQLANTTHTPQQQSQLLASKEQLEQELYRQLPQIQPRLVEPSQIARLLPPGSALVEFQRYRSYDASTNRLGSPRYLALLLRPDGTIRGFPLGEAAPIDAAVAVALATSATAERQGEAPERLAQVSRMVLTPLRQELAGLRELFVSPDGELNRLPLAALPVAAADGPTLGDSVQLRLLTTGRDLLRLQQPARAGGPAVLIANPDFNARGLSSSGKPSSVPPTAAGVRGLTPWQPLAGTELEARQLAPLLRLNAVISGPQATAPLVLRQKAPRILHIATHGFFLADQQRLPESSGATRSYASTGGGVAIPQREDPLQRSGLVFAGANHPDADPADDGYLTAAEVTAMDLEGTELVTLSACETGLGGVRSGEGVYGLQRSLAVAGARSTLLSLWKVDDGLTVTFMEHYYNRLKAGEGRADALRNTQGFFRTHKNSTYNDIRVWGAFQLSGDWLPLPGW